MTVPARVVLQRLVEGNTRFVAGLANGGATVAGRRRRLELNPAHAPLAIVLGCSDARVPAEIVFDQGLGDLFVIRVAGNIVAPSQIGSVEFAASRFATRLVVVLGHAHCGAVAAMIEELQRPAALPSRNLRSIVDHVRPAVEGLLLTHLRHDREALARQATRANVALGISHLRYGSEVLERLARHDGLMVVGAEYSLETGLVEFFAATADPCSAAIG